MESVRRVPRAFKPSDVRVMSARPKSARPLPHAVPCRGFQKFWDLMAVIPEVEAGPRGRVACKGGCTSRELNPVEAIRRATRTASRILDLGKCGRSMGPTTPVARAESVCRGSPTAPAPEVRRPVESLAAREGRVA